MDFDDIMEARMRDYRPFRREVPFIRKPRSLISAIETAKSGGRRPVIAEIKPASPTAGRLRRILDAGRLARDFAANGACGVSVLTEPRYFCGSLEYLRQASRADVPVLRKDFLFDPQQIKESYFYGADSLLLIAHFYSTETLAHMIAGCRDYGMEPLVEVHGPEDVDRAASAGAGFYAINNRDRRTLQVDRAQTARLAGRVDGVTVSASGISTVTELEEALRYCDAALVGTALMTAIDPGQALKTLVW